MLIKAVTFQDIQTWLNLSHEWDKLVGELISDVSIFYEGFDDYMVSKIRQHEAFMAVDRMSEQCIGIVAFSKSNNRISYFRVSKNTALQLVGSKLIEIALNQLDTTNEISANVWKSDLTLVKQERNLFENYGFIEYDNSVFEAGVPTCLMIKPPSLVKKGYSFHHNYSGYIKWTNQQECPFCRNESVWSDHVLVKEL
jgi:hypothetical protein